TARFAAFDFLGRVEADILFLQETRLPTLAAVFKARREWRAGSSYWSLAAEPYSGVAVLFTAPVESRRVIELEMGRCLILDVLMKGQELRLINIYGPQKKRDRKSLFMRIKPYLFTSRQVIFGGDFNTVTRARDRGGARVGRLSYDGISLNSIASDARLVDVHIRHTAGHSGFTYTRGSCRSRIDRFYLKEEAAFSPLRVVEVDFSDHCLIMFSLNIAESPQKGRGLWRLNSSLLEEAGVRQSFEDFLQSQ
ncbi:Reverse transcriptase (RNA-dependent DNA polymerase), partial [Pristimantis euphronides]